MERDEMFLLNEFLKDTVSEETSDTIKKLAKKIELICNQIELQEEYQSKAQEITNKIDNL